LEGFDLGDGVEGCIIEMESVDLKCSEGWAVGKGFEHCMICAEECFEIEDAEVRDIADVGHGFGILELVA
jgi:hypothetical protein